MLRTILFPLALLLSLNAAAQPFVHSITPSSTAYSGGVQVTLRGEGLRHLCPSPCPAENSLVTFGGKEAQIVSISDTEAVVIAPPHRPGSVDVLVASRASGGGVLLPSAFSYYSDASSFGRGAFLIPILSTGDTPGAYGSLWRTTLSIYHRERGAIHLDPKYLPPPGDPNPSRFAYLGDDADEVAIHLRVQDVSRAAETYGVEIPVVRETDLRIEELMLDNVPTDPRFRVALRIYMVNGMWGTGFASQPFRVRVFRASSEELMSEEVVNVSTPYATNIHIHEEPLYPAIHQNHDFVGSHPAIAAAERVRIEIDPIGQVEGNPVPLYWAFATVTHRETQHVTIVSPP
jgi:hypothetical protein